MATMGHEQRAVPWEGGPKNKDEDGELKIGTRILIWRLEGREWTASLKVIVFQLFSFWGFGILHS